MMKAIAGLISLCVVLPIWFYLLYKILVAVGASELMFFLFWVYVPANIFVLAVVRIVEEK